MGNLHAAEFAALGGRQGLIAHLQSNHYPPIPAVLATQAQRALDVAVEGCEWYDPHTGHGEFVDGTFEQAIEFPPGFRLRAQSVASIIEGMHLEAFLAVALCARFDEDETEEPDTNEEDR